MSAEATTPNDSPPASRWRLWIDGCGGFLLLTGASWSVGGQSHQQQADVCAGADWPRRAGRIERLGDDYFWTPNDADAGRELISANRPLPIPGSAQLWLRQPSPLSNSATLKLKPPHRFSDHVDGVVLTDQTLIIGPQPDCHIHHGDSRDRVVLTCRQDQWLGKAGLASDFQSLPVGDRITLSSLAMTLEQA